jgi:D-serine dehydratase
LHVLPLTYFFHEARLEVFSMNEKRTAPAVVVSKASTLNKGLGYSDQLVECDLVAPLGWNLLNEDLSLPCAVLYEDRLLHNLSWMQKFIDAYGLKLAPHGKTTMAPRLFQMQLQSGAWGITVATAHQALVAYRHGVRRVLMANQLIGKENMAVIGRLIEDSSFTYFCLVDSAEQIDQLGSFFRERGHRLHVLIELGVAGGRSGIRNEQQLNSVLSALSRWPDSIALCGVEIYEGVLDEESSIRAFLKSAVDITRELETDGRFQRKPFLLSGAGSAWYDVVAEVFSEAGFGDKVEIVLRPGCYLTHDVGAYRVAQEKIQKRNPIAHQMRSGLVPALQVWAYVQSVPEAGKAIVGMGKRDVAFDAGLPIPALHFRPGEELPKPSPTHWSLTKMMDQHAYMEISEGDNLRVGDMIGFDISHPCLTFDKWRWLSVVNAEYKVIELIETFF